MSSPEWELNSLQRGHAHNINTGEISLSAAGTLLYVKNTGVDPIFLDDLFISAGTGTQSDSGLVTFYFSPTGGNLISDATAADVVVNRDPSSSEDLTSLANIYKGKSGGTVTGGTVAGYAHIVQSTTKLLNIPIELENGDSFAVYLDPRLSSGSIKVLVDLTAHTDRG